MSDMTTSTRLRALLLATSASVFALAGPALAQTTDNETSDILGEDEVISIGTIQQTIEQSIDFKRSQNVIADALIGAELGELPDLSVAETLERIVGVTSDRFKGGSSEVSIRGLGAFLGSSTLNGREITSGSDGRDVNFGQFPSELVNGALVYKSQQASFIEGGVSGIIELQTLRPLDYGKRRIQLQGLLGYSDYEDRVRDGDPFNERITASYVDQFDVGQGEIGISIGGQLRRDTAAEDIYTSSSSFNVCSSIGGGNCSFSADNTNDFGVDGAYFTSNQYIFRAQATESDRDAIMGNIQYQPTANIDINLDAQYSDRRDTENRANLIIAEGRRGITPIEVSDSGALLAFDGESRLENNPFFRERDEKYIGFGGSIAVTNDKWTVAADVGYSKTERRQDELDMRFRTRDRVNYRFDTRGVDIPSILIDGIDDLGSDSNGRNTFNPDGVFDSENDIAAFLNDPTNYDDFGADRARRRLENNDDEIYSARLDFTRDIVGDGVFNALKFGGRYSERERLGDDAIDTTFQRGDLANNFLTRDEDNVFSVTDPSVIIDEFIVEDLFDGASVGLGAEGLTFANVDPRLLFASLAGSADAGLPEPGESTLDAGDTDVNEKIIAAYVQADIDTVWGSTPVSGNLGFRVVHTDLESTGFITQFETEPGDIDGNIRLLSIDGTGTTNVETDSFVNVLPSLNLSFDIAEDKILRLAAYKAIARPDARDYSSALLSDENDDGFPEIGQAIRAFGSPQLGVLESDNFDVSLEYYPTDNSIFSAAGYYKKLKTGFENELEQVVINVDGNDTPITISRSATTDDSSDLYGFELALQHKFNNLDGFLGGFGLQAAYNFAESDFEFPDPIVQRGIPIADFTDPANISGYSKHSGNVTVFWENDDFNIRLAYKARSRYFKPFRVSQNRFVGGQDFLDASASLDITKNLEIRAQALNLTNEPNVFFRPTRDSLAGADYSGRRYFVGLRARF